MIQNRQAQDGPTEFTAPKGQLVPSHLFTTHRRNKGLKPRFSPLPRSSQTESSVQGDNIFWMSWQPQEKTGKPANGIRLRGRMASFSSREGRVIQLSSSEDWQLPADKQVGFQNVISILVFRTWTGFSNRNNVNRWWFGPRASQIAVSRPHYQLNGLL